MYLQSPSFLPYYSYNKTYGEYNLLLLVVVYFIHLLICSIREMKFLEEIKSILGDHKDSLWNPKSIREREKKNYKAPLGTLKILGKKIERKSGKKNREKKWKEREFGG